MRKVKSAGSLLQRGSEAGRARPLVSSAICAGVPVRGRRAHRGLAASLDLFRRQIGRVGKPLPPPPRGDDGELPVPVGLVVRRACGGCAIDNLRGLMGGLYFLAEGDAIAVEIAH